MPKSEVTRLRAQLSASSRWRGARHPDTIALRSKLAKAVALQRVQRSIAALQALDEVGSEATE